MRKVDLAGTRVYLQEWGQGPTLLCLHGLGGGAHFFAALGQTLADRRHTVAFDFPGSGHTAASAPFTFDDAAQLVIDLIRSNGWGTPVLLGHSMGTIVALEVVRRQPHIAGGLVFVGGLPEPRPEARLRLTERIDQVRRQGMAGLGEGVVMSNFARRTRQERPELTSLFARAFELQNAESYIATATALVSWKSRPLPSLDHLRCLVLTGEEDLYAPPEAVHEFARMLPASTEVHILPDAGHLPFLEQPARVGQILILAQMSPSGDKRNGVH